MSRFNFIQHAGDLCPVRPEALVVYRTTSKDTPVSHVHGAVMAKELVWSFRPSMGRILEYAVVGGN